MIDMVIYRLYWLWIHRPVIRTHASAERWQETARLMSKRANRALEFLEQEGEDGIHGARSCLYDILFVAPPQ